MIISDRNTYVENSVFEPVALKDLVDPSLSFWVHHTQHILKQGRAIFWSTKKPSGEEVSIYHTRLGILQRLQKNDSVGKVFHFFSFGSPVATIWSIGGVVV